MRMDVLQGAGERNLGRSGAFGGERTIDNALLGAIPAADRALISAALRRVPLRSGEVLFEPGREITHLHFPISGVIARIAITHEGRSVHTALVGHEGVSDPLSFAGPCRASVRAVVQSPGDAWKLEAARLRELVEARPSVRAVFEGYVSDTMAALERTAAGSALNRIDARLAAWLLQAHDRADGDLLALTQEQMAGMLGAQRTTVTQIASGLQSAGAIQYRRGKVRVLDRAMLRRLAADGYVASEAVA